MRTWNGPVIAILLGACGVLLVTGCVPGVPQLEGAEREAVLAYAEPATDNLLAGLEAGDYAQFSRDMSPEMLAAMTESQFSALRATLEDKVGAYVSRQVTGVEEGDDFIAVNYDARYEDEEHVSMRVVFDQDRQISGLWLDSPKLRQQ